MLERHPNDSIRIPLQVSPVSSHIIHAPRSAQFPGDFPKCKSRQPRTTRNKQRSAKKSGQARGNFKSNALGERIRSKIANNNKNNSSHPPGSRPKQLQNYKPWRDSSRKNIQKMEIRQKLIGKGWGSPREMATQTVRYQLRDRIWCSAK